MSGELVSPSGLTAILRVEGIPTELPARESIRNRSDLSPYMLATAKFYLNFESPDFVKREELGYVRMTCPGIMGKDGIDGVYDALLVASFYQPLSARAIGLAGPRIKRAVKVRIDNLNIEQLLHEDTILIDDTLRVLRTEPECPQPLRIYEQATNDDSEYFTFSF